MLRDLKEATYELELSPQDARTANRVLRRWVLTHHYRELAAIDLLVESRRFRARGANVRAMALLPLVALLGPRMGLNYVSRSWSARHALQ
jgi:hypothetical protein